MSMSTGDVRQPPGKLSAKAVAADGKKPESAPAATGTKQRGPAGRPGGKGAAKSAGKGSAGKGAAGKGGGGKGGAGLGPRTAGDGKGRKPVTAVKVSQGRNWGPILMFGGTGLVAVLIIGFATFALVNRPDPSKWREQAEGISGISLFLKTNPDWFTPPPEGNHKTGPLTYPSTPPVGGTHNPRWQDCMGDVYAAEIPKEQAVHSLEHGAVWITYRPELPKNQIDELAAKVEGREFMMMSPLANQDKPISLQAWGYQLKVDNADDDRIDEFISALRKNATQEPGAACSGGITDTGATPLDLPGGMNPQNGAPAGAG